MNLRTKNHCTTTLKLTRCSLDWKKKMKKSKSSFRSLRRRKTGIVPWEIRSDICHLEWTSYTPNWSHQVQQPLTLSKILRVKLTLKSHPLGLLEKDPLSNGAKRLWISTWRGWKMQDKSTPSKSQFKRIQPKSKRRAMMQNCNLTLTLRQTWGSRFLTEYLWQK